MYIFEQHEGSRSRTGNRERLIFINLSLTSKWYSNNYYTYTIPFTTSPHNVSLRFRVITFHARSIHYCIIYGKLTYIHTSIYVYRHQGWQKGNETKTLGRYENGLPLRLKIIVFTIIVKSNMKIKNYRGVLSRYPMFMSNVTLGI